MIETTVSDNLWYLIGLHYEYLQSIEGTIDENYPNRKKSDAEYKPILIVKDKDKGVFTLTVDLISNQQIDNNDSTGNSEFSRRTPRVSGLG